MRQFLEGESRPTAAQGAWRHALGRCLALVLCLLPALSAGPVLAATRYVDATSCPAGGDGSQASPFCTIQDGICAASAGDTVSVAPGTYPESIRMKPGVSVVSDSGPAATIINGAGQPCTETDFCTKKPDPQCSVVIFASGHSASTVLEGFTITGGEGIVQPSQVAGGGIFVYSSPVIRNNVIEYNTLAGDRDDYNGGGIYIAVGQPVITGNVIRGNVAAAGAGRKSSPTSSYGGGVMAWFYSTPTITGNLIEGNQAGDPAQAYAVGAGGGVAIFPGPGPNDPLIDGNTIRDNTADTIGGGVALASVVGTVALARVTNNVIHGNSAYRGGGVYTYFNDCEIANNTITENHATQGGGVYSGESDLDHPMVTTNNVIVGNTLQLPGGNGGGFYSLEFDADFDPGLDHNDLYGNQKNQAAGNSWTDANAIGFFGNFSADPLFADPNSHDFHLQAGSPAIDTGRADVAPALDYDGATRGADGDGTPDSPVAGDVDVGAFEFIPGGGCVPEPEVCDGLDNDCNGVIDDGFPDLDGDGIADCVDPDLDGDGVDNGLDNCPGTPNPMQLDRDDDGLGNACDSDADGDGLTNGSDCSPLDPVFNTMPNSGSPRIAFAAGSPDQLVWEPGTEARVYSVYSWDFPVDAPFTRGESCTGAAAPAIAADVSGTPPANTIRGFLVTKSNACGEGMAGSQSNGVPRTAAGGCVNALQDMDGDGYEDVEDNCPLVANVDQVDDDGDGYGNACDTCLGNGSEDDDSDGVCDEVDNCIVVPNAGQADLDGDGQGDDCDEDDDNDGVRDVLDPWPQNAAACGDADGDTCDDCSIGVDGLGPLVDGMASNDGPDLDGDGLCDAGDDDDDGDGFADTIDNCPLLANDQLDTDGDGPGDACDDDDDNDGIEDILDTDPLSPVLCADSDGDGCDDCAIGVDGYGPLPDATPANDGLDTDGDGACNVGDTDDDDDTILDDFDNCALVANVLQLNRDGDALGDVCDDDADGDGMLNEGDCSPLDPVLNAVPGVDGSFVTFDDTTGATLGWQAVSDGRMYAVYTWDFDAAGFSRSESCLGAATAATSAATGAPLAVGTMRGYLVTAINACGEGGTGRFSDATVRTVVGGCLDPAADSDGDGYADVTDNCPLVPNADQADADADGRGDACPAP